MDLIDKRFAKFVASVFIVFSLVGCSGFARSDFSEGAYYPRLPAGISTIHDARSDLARLLRNSAFDSISFQKDMIKESPQPPLSYEDLPDFPIVVEQIYTGKTGYYVFVGLHSSSNLITSRMSIPYLANQDTNLSREKADRIADDLYFIQQYFRKERERRMAQFKLKAKQYRSLTTKPPVSEEQRKYIVQANTLAHVKDYYGAIEMYKKAINVNLVSDPAAYANLALLNAQVHQYRNAIRYMKQYLLLAPDAKDARRAQDNIYSWEIMKDRTAE